MSSIRLCPTLLPDHFGLIFLSLSGFYPSPQYSLSASLLHETTVIIDYAICHLSRLLAHTKGHLFRCKAVCFSSLPSASHHGLHGDFSLNTIATCKVQHLNIPRKHISVVSLLHFALNGGEIWCRSIIRFTRPPPPIMMNRSALYRGITSASTGRFVTRLSMESKHAGAGKDSHSPSRAFFCMFRNRITDGSHHRRMGDSLLVTMTNQSRESGNIRTW